jgi:hypothetical protein
MISLYDYCILAKNVYYFLVGTVSWLTTTLDSRLFKFISLIISS